MRLSAFLSAVLLPALAAPALAAPAGIPADATPLTVTRGNDPVRAHFAAPGRVAWYKVALTKGQDYAIYGEASDASGNVITVYSPAGKSVVSAKIFATGGFYNGAELHATTSGTYYLKVAENPSQTTDIFLGISFDCRGGPSTACTSAVGQTASGNFTFFGDADWRKAALQAGKSYTVTLNTSLTAHVAVLDPRGKSLGSCLALGGFPVTPCHVSFKAASSGTYFLRLYQEDEDSHDYKVTLSSP